MTPFLPVLATWLALSPSGARISVAWDSPGEVFHFDARTGRPVGREFERRQRFETCLLPEQPATAAHVAARVDSMLLPNGSTSVRGIAKSPDGRWAFAAHILARYTVHTSQLEQGWMNTNAISILDVPARKLHGTVLLDDVSNGAANPWAVAVSADSKTLYCTHAGTHELSVIDIPAMLARIGPDSADRLSLLHGIRRRIPLPGKGPRALAVAGAKVFVAEYFTRTIALVMDGVAKPFAAALPPPATPEFRGEMLFHDAGLCFEHWQSCSSCHPGGRADGLNWDLMNDGIGNPKNTRSLLNSHRTGTVMWTGVRPSASFAVRSGMKGILLSEPSEEDANAIEAWLRSLKPVRLPVTDPAAVARGRKLFRSAGCIACHPPPLYTDNALHDVGTHGPADFNNGVPQREFQTPSLIEVWRTAPYLHDGRYATLEEAIRGNPGAAALKDLAAFLRSL